MWCRSLGIPADIVDAAEHLLRMADDFHPFPVDLGRAGDRNFLFSSGVGPDASVVQRVDAHPFLKARFGAWYYAYAAVATFNRRYLLKPPRVRVKAGDPPGRRGDRGRPELRSLHVFAQPSNPSG